MAYTTAQLTSMYTFAHAGLTPSTAQSAQLAELAQLSRTGQLTDAQATYAIVNTADADTAVALQAYQFFTGKTPTQAGLSFLVNSTSNATDLNDSYYQSFSLENRYINFAQNLGLIGEGAARFSTTYASLTFAQTVQTAYETIIGSAYATAAGYNPVAAIADITSRQGYFQLLANERFGGQNQDLAVKAAVVGYIMAEAIKADVGLYAAGVNNFLTDLAADGLAQYNNDLVANYALQTQGVSPAGHVINLTSGFDFPGGSPPSVNTQGQAGDDIYIANSATLAADSINGGAGNDRLLISNTGTNFSASPFLVSVEQIELSSATGGATSIDLTNAIGVTAVVAVGGGTATGPNDVGSGAISVLNAASGLTIIADIDDSVSAGTITFGLKTDGASDSLNLVLRTTDTGGAATRQGLANLTAPGVETLTITSQRATIANTTVDANDTLSIGTLNATGMTRLVLTGDSAIAIGVTTSTTSALTTIDASAMTKGVTLGALAGGITTAAAGATITTGSGDDFVSVNVGTTPAMGALSLGSNGAAGDTLVLNGSAVGGLTVVDLSAGDQVAQIVGTANAAVQSGIENIDLRGLGGNAQVAGTAGVNTIVGTAGNDTINGLGGADIIDVQGGFDTVAISAPGQTGAGITANGALTGVDVITGMGAGDRINLSGFALAAFNGLTVAEGSAYLSGTSGAVALVTGSYVASTAVFTAGAGADLLFEYDTNGATAGGLEAVVLVGCNGGVASVTSDGSGAFTFA